MPYSANGANVEHITNVSDNEIPELVMSIEEWVKVAPRKILDQFGITAENFNTFKVLPRLFFGAYLTEQFNLLIEKGREQGIKTSIYLSCKVLDVQDHPTENKVEVMTSKGIFTFDRIVICTGHYWPKRNEGIIPGYFDSPYPPDKLKLKLNHQVGLKGSSLTAIDAMRTLARANGAFIMGKDGRLAYQLNKGCEQFRLVMLSRSGLLPGVRFHLDNSHLTNPSLLSEEEIQHYRQKHDGFVSLDYLFEKDFKKIIKKKDLAFYEKIKHFNLEQFVGAMLDFREKIDPFTLMKTEYLEAEKSIEERKSVYWKEALAMLSASLNYPAKYLSAEDMLRLKKILMPLISVVIAFVPQSSCEEMFALHEANVLEIVAVGHDRNVEPLKTGGVNYTYATDSGVEHFNHFPTFIDCIGQLHFSFDQFLFKSLIDQQAIAPAKLKFRDPEMAKTEMKEGNQKVALSPDGDYHLTVPGIAINDQFQFIDQQERPNKRIYMMAVPYIGGFNPDYSGLDFSTMAGKKIADALVGKT